FASEASSGFSSMSTLANVTSSCSSEAASKTGANWRHGPHHVAQKSTITVPPSETVERKLSRSRSVILAMASIVGPSARWKHPQCGVLAAMSITPPRSVGTLVVVGALCLQALIVYAPQVPGPEPAVPGTD